MNWKSGVLLGACLLLVGCKVTYNQGYEDGFKDGYCGGRVVCNPPKLFKSTKGYPKPDSVSSWNYDAGYENGHSAGDFKKSMEEIKEMLKRTEKKLENLRKQYESN